MSDYLSLEEYKKDLKNIIDESTRLFRYMHIKNNPEYGSSTIDSNIYREENVLNVELEMSAILKKDIKDIFDYENEFNDIEILIDGYLQAMVQAYSDIYKNCTRIQKYFNISENNKLNIKYSGSLILNKIELLIEDFN